MDDAAQAIMAVSFFGCIAVTVRAIAGVWMKRMDVRRSASLEALDQKLERIDTAIDAIALEVERISEAQRFTARVLAERDAGKLPLPGRPSDGRVITPH